MHHKQQRRPEAHTNAVLHCSMCIDCSLRSCMQRCLRNMLLCCVCSVLQGACGNHVTCVASYVTELGAERRMGGREGGSTGDPCLQQLCIRLAVILLSDLAPCHSKQGALSKLDTHQHTVTNALWTTQCLGICNLSIRHADCRLQWLTQTRKLVILCSAVVASVEANPCATSAIKGGKLVSNTMLLRTAAARVIMVMTDVTAWKCFLPGDANSLVMALQH